MGSSTFKVGQRVRTGRTGSLDPEFRGRTGVVASLDDLRTREPRRWGGTVLYGDNVAVVFDTRVYGARSWQISASFLEIADGLLDV